MHFTSSHNQPSTEKLTVRLNSLPQSQTLLIELLSIIFEPVKIKVLEYCLTSIEGSRLQEYLPKDLNSTLRRMQSLGLIDWKHQCNPCLVEIISRQAVKQGSYSFLADIVRRELPSSSQDIATFGNTSRRCLRDVRIGLYSKDFELFNSSLFRYYDCSDIPESASPLLTILNNPFDADLFASLPFHLQLPNLHEIINDSLLLLSPCAEALNYLLKIEQSDTIPAEGQSSLYYLLIKTFLLRGEIGLAREAMKRAGDKIVGSGLHGWAAFLLGNNEVAISSFTHDLKIFKRRQDQNSKFFTGIEGVFFILALLKTADYAQHHKIIALTDSIQQNQPYNLFLSTYSVISEVVGRRESFKKSLYSMSLPITQKNSVTGLLQGLASFWINGYIDPEQHKTLSTLYTKANAYGYQWLAMEYAQLLAHGQNQEKYLTKAQAFQKKTAIVSLSTVVQPEARWQRALKALNTVSIAAKDHKKDSARLFWMLAFDHGFVTISPKEQKLTKSTGTWSKGRPVALQRLYSGKNLKFLSDQDQKIRAALKKNKTNYSTSYDFNMTETLLALVGHPHLFLAESPNVSIEVVKGEPELQVKEHHNQLHLEFFPDIMAEKEKVLAIRETPTRFKVIEISAKHRRIATIMGGDGLLVPVSAKEQVLQTLGKLSSCMTVHSAIGGPAQNIKEIQPDSNIIIHLLPVGSGFRLSMLVKPMGSGGPFLRPGQGTENIIAVVDKERLQARRNLTLEIENFKKIEAACPTLFELENQDWEWEISDLQVCLQLLQELRNIQDQVSIEWPKGEKLAISQQVSFKQLHLRIRKKNDWFELQGGLELNQDKVVEFQQLLSLVHTHPGNKFIPLGDGKFIALSKEFQKQLEEIYLFSEVHDKKLRLHPLAAATLEGLENEQCHLDTDAHWQGMIKRMREIEDLHPIIPTTLQAELRDYQIEGYNWLSRLAHWGAGACLADDMGLGKTVQALAIILAQAKQGPSLVVAPTSVCLNWQEEIKLFAPTLNVRVFGGINRARQLTSLAPFDLVIVSYGLLQHEADLLATIQWQIIVLDEAQAIKNMATKRSRAAMALQGAFKIITTGTPIENHLGELWNLFNFINPGLLGPLKRFNKKYANPIERHQDRTVQRRLKKIIQPFILRRLKFQVLEELPSRTEVTLQVEMSVEETAFYEALRQEAVHTIEKSRLPGGQKHLRILAEIMKLRRACCHPRLVTKDSSITSSKLAVFANIIDELLENRHKALVFSQFVGHLDIIRELLDKKEISYCYLDGSTPAKKRKRQIQTFQAGAADLFLISLKAGGVGLNLTAADYVIHMDPWWNPAVEDQASDRAHRIGQKRPVTIYRLVTQNSIEEKILKLHAKKRDLADSLLDSGEMGAKLDADELLQLLRER